MKGHLEIHVPEVAPVEAFGDPEGFRLRVPGTIEPSPVIETGAIDHQNVLPLIRPSSPARWDWDPWEEGGRQ